MDKDSYILKREMNRRQFIQMMGGSVLPLISGCSDSNNFPNSTRKMRSSASKSVGNGRPDVNRNIRRAITISRQRLNSALKELNSSDVMEDGEVGIASSDNFEKYRDINENEVIGPTSEAMRKLEGIRSQARGENAATGKVLLGIAVYTDEKWKEYSDIVRAFTAFSVSLSKISESDARKSLDAAQDAMSLLTNVVDHRKELVRTLERIRSADGDPGLDHWDPAREASELRVLGDVLKEMLPTFGGLRSFVNGTAQAGKAVTLTRNGKYSEAMHFATSARANIDNATTQFRTALDRNVRYFGDLVAMFECQTSRLYLVTATLVDAIQAYEDGNQTKGKERLSDYLEGSDRALQNCSPSTPTSPSATETN